MSDARGSREKHLVDVCANNGEGQCDCGAFVYRKINPCKHMRAVYYMIGKQVAHQIYSQYEDGDEERQI